MQGTVWRCWLLYHLSSLLCTVLRIHLSSPFPVSISIFVHSTSLKNSVIRKMTASSFHSFPVALMGFLLGVILTYYVMQQSQTADSSTSSAKELAQRLRAPPSNFLADFISRDECSLELEEQQGRFLQSIGKLNNAMYLKLYNRGFPNVIHLLIQSMMLVNHCRHIASVQLPHLLHKQHVQSILAQQTWSW
jgi:hypothetical protein